ncbi:MAG: GH36-type glycosyl hydrolase domain-containing protein [Pseudomonadota bacterium]
MNHPDHPQALPSPDRRAMASFMRILGASGCAVAAIAWIACADQTATAWLITVALTWLALSILGGETATLSPSRRLRDRVRDAALVGVLAWSVDPAASLWAMPEAWHQVPTLTHGAATLIAAAFLFASLVARARRQAALAHPAALAFLAVPVGFNLLLLLGNNTLLAQWGQALTGPILHPAAHAAVGRTLLLGGINLAAVWGMGLLVDGRASRDIRLLAAAVLCGGWAAWTPVMADWGSIATLVAWHPLAALTAVVALAALAQAGLWAQTFFITALLMQGLRDQRPQAVTLAPQIREGATKGAVYGALFMLILGTAALLHRNALFRHWLETVPWLAGALLGPLLFGLARTLVESFDGSAPFVERLRRNLLAPTNYARGVVLGFGIALLIERHVIAMSADLRFLSGFLVGALAGAGVDGLMHGVERLRGRRQRFDRPRIYAFAALLSGGVGGMLTWYFDAAQLQTVGEKLLRYAQIHGPTAGQPVYDYVTYPLFSRWGAIHLGAVSGGLKQFYCDSLAGVINWSIAAPLFSINLIVLNAIFNRSLEPLRHLLTRDGLANVVTQAVRVQRWGLWMAPIIQTFLKMAPNPAWYNQDGAIRTGLATVQGLRLDEAAFRQWSLQTFLGLMTYGWLRILIWFDHMGLRVATLVNLSFIGLDRLEARLSRWLGHASPTPVIPEGIRRFATWAPLLLPFYIPRGAEWDFVWQESQRLATASDSPFIPAAGLLLGVYLAAALAGILGLVWMFRRLHHTREAHAARLVQMSSGRLQLEMDTDGNSRALVHTGRGPALDFSRRAADGALPHGQTFYLQSLQANGSFTPPIDLMRNEVDGTRRIWRTSDGNVALTRILPGDLEIRVMVEPCTQIEAMRWRVRLVQHGTQAQRLRVTSYLEWALNHPDAYLRRPDFNAIHIGVRYLREPAALLAHNRLLGGDKPHQHPAGCGFIAFEPNPAVRLCGYEDDRSRFLGRGTADAPDALIQQTLRDPTDEGLLYPFDPAAALQVELDLAPEEPLEIAWIQGWADSEPAALSAIGALHGAPTDNASRPVDAMPARRVLPRAGLVLDAGFSAHGPGFEMSPDTPRPWTHILANRQGYGVLIGNDGAQFSFAGNAQQNGLTPFTLDTMPAQSCAQALYITDLETGALLSPGFTPLRQDAAHRVRFEPGEAVLMAENADLALTLRVVVAPDEPLEVRVLRVENRTAETRTLRLTAYAQLALAELPQDSHRQIATTFNAALGACLFSRPGQIFHAGTGFLAIDLPIEAHTFNRRAFWGTAGDATRPGMALTGHAEADRRPDGATVAALCGVFELEPYGARELVVLMGQAASGEEAERLIKGHGDPTGGRNALSHARRSWRGILGQLRIETDHPDFDRLVNDWLPYQVLTARLWGRLGPNQRSGAFGFRDQLQDVLPLIWIWPALAREQILAHAAVQFREGDVLKWWHPAARGGIGLGQRSRASDPHLWLPYVTAQYVTASGDWAVLDTELPYLEGRPIPAGQPDIAFVPRISRDADSLYHHCRRAIDLSLTRRGARGLPLIGAGDWNDGLDQLGLEGRGESGWMALFLIDVLQRFLPLTERMAGTAAAERDRAAIGQLRKALDRCWMGDRFLRATSDAGEIFAPLSALMSAWPAIAGATGFERAETALNAGLAGLETPDLIRLLNPAFDADSRPYPGRIALYPPGVRENGGQYSHGSSWLIDAALALSAQAGQAGDKARAEHWHRRAWELWRKLSPLDKDPLRYGLPPYQQAADVYWGAGHDGRGGWTGYTGAAARMLWTAYGLLGLHMENGSLRIDPPAEVCAGIPRLRAVHFRGHRHMPDQRLDESQQAPHGLSSRTP